MDNTKLSKVVYTRQTTAEEIITFLTRVLSSERKLSLPDVVRKTGRCPPSVMRVLRDVFNCSEDEHTSLRQGRHRKFTDSQQRLLIVCGPCIN